MTFPWQLHIFNHTVPLHSILETAGIFAGFRYFIYLRARNADPIDTSNRIWIIIGALFGAVLGSRIIGGLENPDAAWRSANILLHFYQHKTILGGLLGGVAGVELTKLAVRERTPSGDLFTFPIILAMIIGRIGCFGMGIYEDTYGLPTGFPWGMQLGDEYSRHPVALYEITFLVLLWVTTSQLKTKVRPAPGAVFKFFMISYLVFRFFLDFIKPRYTFSFGLSTIQITAVLGLIYYAAYIFHPKKLLADHART